MQENRDGTFEPIKPFSEFMENISEMGDDDYETVKSFHFGTEDELNEIKERKSLERRFDDLEGEVEKLKTGEKRSEYVVFPTPEEIKKFASKGPMERNMLKIMRGISYK